MFSFYLNLYFPYIFIIALVSLHIGNCLAIRKKSIIYENIWSNWLVKDLQEKYASCTFKSNRYRSLYKNGLSQWHLIILSYLFHQHKLQFVVIWMSRSQVFSLLVKYKNIVSYNPFSLRVSPIYCQSNSPHRNLNQRAKI